MNLKDFNRSGFMALFLGAVIILLYPVLVFPKGELELLINRFHFPTLDFLFKYVTILGDGAIMAILLVVLLFYNYYTAMLTAVSIIAQSILVSIFKRWLFADLKRPLAFFGEDAVLNFVEGVKVHSSNTFPSGHTTTGFAVFALLFVVFNNRNNMVATSLFVLAMLVGFSRVYLLQHFVVDVYVGAIIGVFSVLIGLIALPAMFNDQKIQKFKNESLLTLITKRKSAKANSN